MSAAAPAAMSGWPASWTAGPSVAVTWKPGPTATLDSRVKACTQLVRSPAAALPETVMLTTAHGATSTLLPVVNSGSATAASGSVSAKLPEASAETSSESDPCIVIAAVTPFTAPLPLWVTPIVETGAPSVTLPSSVTCAKPDESSSTLSKGT